MDCSFDRRAIDCLWAGEEGANPTWMIASTPLNKHKLQSLTGTDQMPGLFVQLRIIPNNSFDFIGLWGGGEGGWWWEGKASKMHVVASKLVIYYMDMK